MMILGEGYGKIRWAELTSEQKNLRASNYFLELIGVVVDGAAISAIAEGKSALGAIALGAGLAGNIFGVYRRSKDDEAILAQRDAEWLAADHGEEFIGDVADLLS